MPRVGYCVSIKKNKGLADLRKYVNDTQNS
jgi:hypothetical protein